MYTKWYNVMEKFEVTSYGVQDAVISAIYIVKARSILVPSNGYYRDINRPIFNRLVGIMFLTIILDFTVMIIEYIGLYDIETTFRTAAYGVKMRLEFVVLNQLIKAVRRNETQERARESSRTIGSGGRLVLDTLRISVDDDPPMQTQLQIQEQTQIQERTSNPDPEMAITSSATV
jgi:hypothetical protein